MARRHLRLADLALTFPGLLFTLAVREGACAWAIALAIGGAPLRKVAAAAGMPLWLRSLPPEAFTAPLDALPDGNAFVCRIANHLPRSRKRAAAWLAAVSTAADAGDADIAIWMAREVLRLRRGPRLGRLRLLSLYAWYSCRPETMAAGLLRKPWEARMGGEHALAEAEVWIEGVSLALELGGRPLDPWLEPGTVMGFEFVPLSCAEDIRSEAGIMRNCVQRYGNALARDRHRLWSVRRDGRNAATLSLGFYGPLPSIAELKGPANVEAPKDIWLAARRWVDRHDLAAFERPDLRRPMKELDRSVWVAMWRPYWLEKRRIPGWLPLSPGRDSLRTLRRNYE